MEKSEVDKMNDDRRRTVADDVDTGHGAPDHPSKMAVPSSPYQRWRRSQADRADSTIELAETFVAGWDARGEYRAPTMDPMAAAFDAYWDAGDTIRMPHLMEGRARKVFVAGYSLAGDATVREDQDALGSLAGAWYGVDAECRTGMVAAFRAGWRARVECAGAESPAPPVTLSLDEVRQAFRNLEADIERINDGRVGSPNPPARKP